MRPMLTKLPVIAFAVLAAASAAFAQDKIHKKDNSQPLEGDITTMTYKEVGYDSQAGSLSEPARNVREVEFDLNNVKLSDFLSAERAFKDNAWGEAITRFERVIRDPNVKDPAKQTARWYIIRCHLEAADAAKAIAAAKKLRADAPDSFYVRDSYMLQFDAARQAGAAAVDEAVKDFEKGATEKGIEDWKKGLDMVKADIAESKGDWRGAKTIYDKYAADKEFGVQAQLGVLRCLGGLKDWSGLSQKSENMITAARGKDARMMMGGYLGRGRALLEGEKKYKEALLDLARCVFDIAPKLGESSREHELAIAYAGIAAARFSAQQTEPEKKNLYRDRAYQMHAELSRKYQGSPLLKDVEEEVKKIPK